MRLLCLLCVWMVAGPVTAADPDPTGNARGRLEAFLDGLETYTADFEQRLYDEYGELLETANGTVAILRPGRFRWEYSEPAGQLVVSDGDRLWMYDQDLEQVTVRPVDDTLRGTPAMLLSGQATLDETFEILRTFEKDELDWVALRPKDGSPEFASLQIGLDEGVVRRMELVDSLGQMTRIDLWDVVTDAEPGDDLFAFEPPEGADVIGQGGSL